MNFYEGMGWIALCLNLLGNLDLVNKSIRGWLIRLGCNIAFIIYSYAFGLRPLLVNHIVFAGVNILGWIRWSKPYKCNCGRRYGPDKYGTMCICELPIIGKLIR